MSYLNEALDFLLENPLEAQPEHRSILELDLEPDLHQYLQGIQGLLSSLLSFLSESNPPNSVEGSSIRAP